MDTFLLQLIFLFKIPVQVLEAIMKVCEKMRLKVIYGTDDQHWIFPFSQKLNKLAL